MGSPSQLGSLASHTRAPGSTTWTKLPPALKRGIVILSIFSLACGLFQLAVPLYSMQIYDRVLASGSRSTLVAISLIVGILILSGALLDAVRATMLVRIANALELHWRPLVLRGAADGHGPATAMASCRDLETLKACLTGSGFSAALDIPWSFLPVMAIFALSPLLGWITVAGAGLIVLSALVGEMLSAHLVQASRSHLREAQQLFDAAAASWGLVRALGAESRLRRRVAGLRDRATTCGTRALDRAAWAAAAARGLRSLLQMTILMSAAYLVLAQQMPIGIIVASSLLVTRALAPLERVAGSYRQLRAAWQALSLLMAAEMAGKPTSSAISLPPLSGDLELKGVVARHARSGGPGLRDITFRLQPGQVATVLGPSGSGKSTLARLVAGAIQPASGTVRLDGASLATWDPEQLGRQIGFLDQAPDLFAGSSGLTIAEIIARFDDPDDAQVIAAARQVGAHKAILRLPQGYRTPGGSGLSAGERQLVALARAFYGAPRLLVLDEPTAFLDNTGEQHVIAAIADAKKRGCTILLVSRLAIMMQMSDFIIYLGHGRLKRFQPRADVEAEFGLRLIAKRNAPAQPAVEPERTSR